MRHDPKSDLCGTPECSACTMRESVLFARVDDAHIRPLQHAILSCHPARGSRLYRMGERADSVFTLRSGLMKLVRYLPEGEERIVRLVRPGDVAGLEALVGERYQHDALVEEPSTLCRIPVKVLERLAAEEPRLYRELLERWQRTVAEADLWLTELATGSARARVASLLRRLVDEHGQGICRLFGRKDVAAMLGITTETASRTIAEFKREGILLEEQGRFRVDLVRLRRE